ncbi:MAG TPA: immunoglobulin domain-containing protein [Thermoanaerobaculia bacterium]|nr:immunoglobulin domain-containing protein [Thermoanaerobaculia bacterium]
MKLKYPRTIRTKNDLPSVAAPRTRIGPHETTLYSVTGFTLCGGYCTNGPMNLELAKDEATQINSPFFHFGYGSPDCRAKVPIKAMIDAVDTAYQAYDPPHSSGGCTSGCGYMWSVIRVTGYGFWEEVGDASSVGTKVVPAMYPVVKIEYLCPPKFGGVGGPTDGTDACSTTGGTGDGPGGTGDGSGSGGTPTPPSSSPRVILTEEVRTTPVAMTNSSSSQIPFSVFAQSTSTSDVQLSATSDAEDLLASVSPSTIPAPGLGDAIATIRTTSTTRAGIHAITITAFDGTTSASATIFVTIACDPPLILGIDQPKNTTVTLGRPANLTVKASGSGPLTYQWFSGAKGLVNFPLAIGSSPNFTTSAINDTASYWVRVSNPCGSVDSQTVTVSVAASAKPASSPRH